MLSPKVKKSQDKLTMIIAVLDIILLIRKYYLINKVL